MPRALTAVVRLARRCRDELAATQLYLFGSRARDTWHRGSDCDVMVISDRFAGLKPWDRWIMVEALWDGPVSIQPTGLTPAEFAHAKGRGGLVDMAIADGMVPQLEEV